MDRTRRIPASRVVVVLVFCLGTAAANPVEGERPTVYAKGLSASIEGTRLRPAKLVFTDTHLVVDLPGHGSERFDYETIRFQRTRKPVRWTLFDKKYWLSALSGAPLALLLGPYYMAGYFGAIHAVEVSRWLGTRGERQRLGLHSDGPHRCSQLALPRNKKLRNAILDEFARRFTGKLQTRAPDSFSLPAQEPYPAAGIQAPDFTLTALNGMAWNLARMRGNIVLVNFWASWCEPCRQELPQLQRLYERYSDDGLVVIGVSDEDPVKTRQYLEERGIGYPSLHDDTGNVMQSYQITAIPTSLIIGRDGQLVRRMEGYTPISAFENALWPLLAPTSADSGR
ncbi:MAG: TlpA disulfide reductase family protein [Bryobacterales bacterium]|nr:TlpA disulfide reductase family protein [Bryobacterales bacterium]